MTALVLLDHVDGHVTPASRSAITAAAALGEVHVLVTGTAIGGVAEAASRIAGVGRVLRADAELYDRALAEPLAALLVSLAPGYDHVLAAATASGKNVIPRAAALLDVQPISEIVAVVDAETFVRPIYAGNALATVRSADSKKLITVRAANFDAAAAEGGSAAIEDVQAGEAPAAISRFVSTELSKSERPELASARVVISGGRGMQNGENFKLIEPVADALGGGDRCVARGGRCGLRAERLPGRPDRQDRGA